MSEAQETAQQPQTKQADATEQKSEFGKLLDRNMRLDEGGIELKNLEDLLRFAQYVVNSGLAPKGDTVSAVVVKVQAGLEIGFSPMRALSALFAVNGRVGIMGDAAKALIRSKNMLKPGTNFDTQWTGEGDTLSATVTAWRKGMAEPTSRRFSIADAKRAGLIRADTPKDSPWLKYPMRQVAYRALGFLARDDYSDVLLGLPIVEELRDFPAPRATPTAKEPVMAPQEADPIFKLEA